MESRVIADLRRYAGKINCIKIRSDDQPNNLCDHKVKIIKSQPVESTELNIDSIVALIKPPLSALRDNSGYIYDSSTIAVRCIRGHIHKYLISDIVKSVIKCATCNYGNKFATMVREQIEGIFEMPFVRPARGLDSEVNSAEFSNPLLKLHVACSKVAGPPVGVFIGDILLIRVGVTTSTRKLRASLHTSLIKFPNHFKSDFLIKVCNVKPPCRKVFAREPLPYTPEMAAVLIAGAKAYGCANPLLNIVDDGEPFCLENC